MTFIYSQTANFSVNLAVVTTKFTINLAVCGKYPTFAEKKKGYDKKKH